MKCIHIQTSTPNIYAYIYTSKVHQTFMLTEIHTNRLVQEIYTPNTVTLTEIHVNRHVQ